MFNPESEVKAYRLELARPKKGAHGKEYAWLSLLSWMEGGMFLTHCLELDIAAQGTSEKEALEHLADLLVVQVGHCEETGAQLVRHAPKEFWDKHTEIRENHIRQRLSSKPPRSAKEILKGLKPNAPE